MAKKVKVPEGGRVPVAVLKLLPDEAEKLRCIAEETQVPLAIYIRLIIQKHLRMPLELKIKASDRPKRRVS